MNSQKNSGFTIIETMLFLAISSLLAVMIIVGAGANIDRQRYRDTANSLKSYMQEQYAQAVNINNIRATSLECSLVGSSLTISPLSIGGWPRGADDQCVVLGRYLRSDDGQTITTGPVIAMRTGDAPVAGYRDILQNHARVYSPTGRETYQVAWGNKVSDPFNLMFVRSPQDGAMYVINVGTGSAAGGLGPGIRAATLCIEGQPTGMKQVGVHIPAGASSQSAIQVVSESESTCA